MDGNRRWAKNRFMPAALGHAAGAKRVREIVKTCAEMGVPYLSLFAFSTENWKRPEEEVSSLMGLFMSYLEKEVASMNDNGVRLRVLGDIGRFSEPLQALIRQAEAQTANNTRITLLVCANYGGRWDVLNAARAFAMVSFADGKLAPAEAQRFAHLASKDAALGTSGHAEIADAWTIASNEVHAAQSFGGALVTIRTEITSAADKAVLMRMAQASDTPHEAREVIGAMVAAPARTVPM